MKVWKVEPKPTPQGHKALFLKYCTEVGKPYQIEVWKGQRRVRIQSFETKPAALDWADLNHKGAEIKDFTDQGPRRFVR